MSKVKDEHLNQILWMTAKYPAFQRNSIYRSRNASPVIRTNLKNDISDFLLTSVLKPFKNSKITETRTINVIKKLSERISQNYKRSLKNGGFTIGTSQKIISVYLKSMWITGNTITTPALCPIDGVILKYLKVRQRGWSKFNLDEYKEIIGLCKERMKMDVYRNLSEWELDIYNNQALKIAGRNFNQT